MVILEVVKSLNDKLVNMTHLLQLKQSQKRGGGEMGDPVAEMKVF